MNQYLTIVTRNGFAVKVDDVVSLTDGTLTTVLGQTGSLMEHTGGFCRAEKVQEINHRPLPSLPFHVEND